VNVEYGLTIEEVRRKKKAIVIQYLIPFAEYLTVSFYIGHFALCILA
jgi:hypothetical protein